VRRTTGCGGWLQNYIIRVPGTASPSQQHTAPIVQPTDPPRPKGGCSIHGHTTLVAIATQHKLRMPAPSVRGHYSATRRPGFPVARPCLKRALPSEQHAADRRLAVTRSARLTRASGSRPSSNPHRMIPLLMQVGRLPCCPTGAERAGEHRALGPSVRHEPPAADTSCAPRTPVAAPVACCSDTCCCHVASRGAHRSCLESAGDYHCPRKAALVRAASHGDAQSSRSLAVTPAGGPGAARGASAR
jgi:hypothetical protein